MKKPLLTLAGVVGLLFSTIALASSSGGALLNLKATHSSIGMIAMLLFIVAYVAVIAEEFTHMKKSKPMIVAAGLMWMLVAWFAGQKDLSTQATVALNHNLLEYAHLLLFLLVAMTFVNAMRERGVFDHLKVWLIKKGYNYRKLFWITGAISFILSPVADNLTTAIVMCAVVMAVGKDNKKFICLSCINIVVCANAGGAFSPFGDITTLMVWQAGILPFQDFFALFLPSLVNAVVPCTIMSLAVPNVKPEPINESVTLKMGAKRIMLLFLFTILMAVMGHNNLHLPPMLGMMTGLGFLMLFSFYLKKREPTLVPFDIFRKVELAEWDTLLFFYGIVFCVGALSALGYLEFVSNTIYVDWAKGLSAMHAATPANVFLGALSAIIDNIPVMFAVITMDPAMSHGQWLLATLTTGVGGSLLSIGSAAGVALMGQAKQHYTFFGHLKWIWAIALGYVASIFCHIWVNSSQFHTMLVR